MYIHIHLYVYIYIYTHTHTYVCMYIYTHTQHTHHSVILPFKLSHSNKLAVSQYFCPHIMNENKLSNCFFIPHPDILETPSMLSNILFITLLYQLFILSLFYMRTWIPVHLLLLLVYCTLQIVVWHTSWYLHKNFMMPYFPICQDRTSLQVSPCNYL